MYEYWVTWGIGSYSSAILNCVKSDEPLDIPTIMKKAKIMEDISPDEIYDLYSILECKNVTVIW